ncbi:hypothetical protein VMT65_07600 [Nocardia sp. CDC153]|nr:hypothetical protein [Nocardia sp. CDC153]
MILAGGALLSVTGTAGAQSYSPDTVIMTNENHFDITYADAVQMFTHWADDIRQAGGCPAFINANIGAATILPVGMEPVVAACNEAIAGH